jgi:hypothetical protein
MNRVDSVWAVGERQGIGNADVREGVEVVEVVLSWRDARSSTVLGVKQVKAGETLALGERGDLLVPEEVLCADRAEIVRFEGDTATAILPPGGKMRLDGWPREERELEIASGHVVEIMVGAFVARLSRVKAESRPAGAPLTRLKEAGIGVIAGSALLHAAVFATIAFTCPSLGATEEDPYDRDRIMLMQKMLNAHAQEEQESKPDDQPQATGGDVNAGAPARGLEGLAGKEQAPERDARWAARGTATPENATLARERALREAQTWGLIGMLPSALTSPDAPTVAWGTELNGSDDVNKVGRLFGTTPGDAWGTGGWGLSGPGEGGGGTFQAIGLGGFGGLGHTGQCIGNSPCSGIGGGYGHPGGGYKPRKIRMVTDGGVSTNGHLPPEVIQRIVRQNFGRYTFCYQNGLRNNPNLEGRVTVRFVIARDGSVAIAADGGSDIPDTAVRQCVVSSFSNLSFPAPENGTVTVVYPLTFHPE